MNNRYLIYISILVAMICWAFSFVWYKQVYVYYKPVSVIMMRLAISVPLLMTMAFLSGKLKKVQKPHRLWFILLAFFQPFLYFMGESYGVSMVSSTLASVIVSTIPLFAAMAARYFFREKFTAINFTGLVVSVGGLVMVVAGDGAMASGKLKGVLLMTLAVMAAVFYSVMVRKLLTHYNVITLVTYQNLIGLFLFIPVFLFTELPDFMKIRHSIVSLAPVIKMSLFASTLAFLLFNHALKHLGMARSNVFINLIPVLTAVFSFRILHENFTTLKVSGIVLVVGGLMLSQLGSPEQNHIPGDGKGDSDAALR